MGIFKGATISAQPTTPTASLPSLALLFHPKRQTLKGIPSIPCRVLSRTNPSAASTSSQPTSLQEKKIQISLHLPPPHFSELPLDRAGHLRRQPDALEQLLSHPSARVIAFYERKALVAPLTSLEDSSTPSTAASPQKEVSSNTSDYFKDPSTPEPFTLAPLGEEAPDGGPPSWALLTWHPSSPELANTMDTSLGYLFLGLSSTGAPIFACQLTSLPASVESAGKNEDKGGRKEENGADLAALPALVDVRSQGQKMTGPDAAILALAVGLLQWHTNTRYCSRTGAPMAPASGGHARRAVPPPEGSAAARGSSTPGGGVKKPRAVYPRMDPAVIVAVTYGDWFLLGRKKTWDKGRYSLLAGFAEVGETLEAAVLREIYEESGVFVDFSSIQYHSSQPWPFPQSLMIGFLGEAQCINSATMQQVTGFDALPHEARRAAMDVGLRIDEATAYALPAVEVDANELEDARWFHKEWLQDKVLGLGPRTISKTEQSCLEEEESKSNTSLNQPEFRIPGKYALANRIITDWLLGAAAPKFPSSSKKINNSSSSSGASSSFDELSSSSSWSGAALPSAKIDEGTFKYVLLRVSAPGGSPSKLLVRGDTRAAYHNHVFTACKAEVAAVDPQLNVEVLGGGRIEHYSSSRNESSDDSSPCTGGVASVYGYSAAYGPAPHEVTAAVLKQWNPFLEVSVSYDGY